MILENFSSHLSKRLYEEELHTTLDKKATVLLVADLTYFENTFANNNESIHKFISTRIRNKIKLNDTPATILQLFLYIIFMTSI